MDRKDGARVTASDSDCYIRIEGAPSVTKCTQAAFDFPPVKRRRVQGELSGGEVTSDAGALLLRQAWPEVRIVFRVDSGFCRWTGASATISATSSVLRAMSGC